MNIQSTVSAMKLNLSDCWWTVLISRVLMLSLLSACGGEGNKPFRAAQAPVITAAPAKNGEKSPAQGTQPDKHAAAVAPQANPVTNGFAQQLARLGAIPLLSSLPESERVKLLKQLFSASPSQRLALVNGFPVLAGLPDPQKERLLNQLESVVPITVRSSQLICQCSDGITRELCVRENCSDRAALASECNRACGTLAAFKNQCFPSRKC